VTDGWNFVLRILGSASVRFGGEIGGEKGGIPIEIIDK
jgi:hypothetical protein